MGSTSSDTNTIEHFRTSESARKSRSKKTWTANEESLFFKMLSEGATSKEIGQALKRTKKSIDQHRFLVKHRKEKVGRDYRLIDERILAYTAGILDGEGYIGIRRSHGIYYSPVVEVSNTSSKLCNFLKSTFGGNVFIGRRPNRKPYYRWMLASRQADEFFRVMRSFLVIKQDQVDLVLKLREESDFDKHAQMFEEMKRLHRYD